MMIEDRGGAGPQALQGAVYAMMGTRRRRRPGSSRSSRCSRPRRRSSISTSTAPRRSCSASTSPTCSTRCRSISARPTSTTSTCSAAPSACTAQADARLPARAERRAQAPRAQHDRRDGAARLLHDRARHLRALPRAALQPLSGGRARRRHRARLSRKARRSTIMEKLAAETLPPGFGFEWTALAFQQISAPATPRSSPSRSAWCSCSWCWPRSTRA